MRRRTLTRAADALHRAEVERWHAAWRVFWNDVEDAEPEAADALDNLFASLSDAVLDALARGTVPDALVTFQAEADAAFARWSDGRPTAPASPAWAAWWETTGDSLPRPDAVPPDAPDAPDLARWPSSVPLPPEMPDGGEAARYRAHLAEALPGSPDAAAAASCLLQLATVRTLRALSDARP